MTASPPPIAVPKAPTPPTPTTRARRDSALALAAPGMFVVVWSTGFIGAKLGMPYAEPLTFMTLRMAGVLVLLGLIVAVTRPPWPDRAGAAHSAITGLLAQGFYLGGVFVAISQGLSAGVAALIISLQPVFVSVLAGPWFGERVSTRQWGGLALGLSGVGLVVRNKLAGGDATLIGWAAILLALAGITFGTLYQKRFGARTDWRPGLIIQYATAGALCGVGALLFETRVVAWTGEFVFALAWQAVVLSFGAVWLLYWLIARSAAARVGSLFYLTAPVTALMAWALFGERLDFLSIVGMGVCVAGVFLVNWRTAPPAAS